MKHQYLKMAFPNVWLSVNVYRETSEWVMTLCQCDLPYITSVSALLARRARSGRPGRTSTLVHGEITKKNSDWSTSTCVHPDWSVRPWWNSNKKSSLVSQTMLKFLNILDYSWSVIPWWNSNKKFSLVSNTMLLSDWSIRMGPYRPCCSLIGQSEWAHTDWMANNHGEIQLKFKTATDRQTDRQTNKQTDSLTSPVLSPPFSAGKNDLGP